MPGARTRLVAVLVLDLVDRQRQVLVRRVQVLHHEGEHLLVGGAEQVVGALAVLEPEDAVAVLGPAAGGLVGLAGQQRGEQQLLGADRVHLVADDVLDPAQHPQAQRQPGVDARARCGGCSRPGRSSRWLGTSASAGSSRRVRTKRLDMRRTVLMAASLRALGPATGFVSRGDLEPPGSSATASAAAQRRRLNPRPRWVDLPGHPGCRGDATRSRALAHRRTRVAETSGPQRTPVRDAAGEITSRSRGPLRWHRTGHQVASRSAPARTRRRSSFARLTAWAIRT